MINFIVGFIFGVAACTIGFTGMAHIADKGVTAIHGTIKKAE